MTHDDHVDLLRDGVAGGGVWADLGSGEGAFTLALAELLGPGAQILSVDRDRRALHRQAAHLGRRFPAAEVSFVTADFTQPVGLPGLGGIVMANSLHFVRDKAPVLRTLLEHLEPGGRFVLVEYDADAGNPWVPYPLSYRTWEALAASVGLGETRLLRTVPSRFLGRIYSSLGLMPDG